MNLSDERAFVKEKTKIIPASDFSNTAGKVLQQADKKKNEKRA